MPEGDSIHRLALRLAPKLEDRIVAEFQARRISNDGARSIVGHRIVSVGARGKNLLVTFDDGRVLHVHLRMHGRVGFEKPRSAFWNPRPTNASDLRIVVPGATVVGRNLPVCRLLTASQAKTLPELAGLGPDLVERSFDASEALKRLRDLPVDTEIANALLIQRAAAGIGNVYKSEVLFLEKVDPKTPVKGLGDDVLEGLLRRASVLLGKNLGNGPRVTRPSLGGPRLWVYGRVGRPCLKCGTVIAKFTQNVRSTYWCPKCQG